MAARETVARTRSTKRLDLSERGLERYRRSANARGRKDQRLGTARRGDKYRLGDSGSARDGRRLRHRSRRMYRELTNRTQSGVGADLRGRDTVVGNRALVKMSDADQLRDK